MNNPDSKIELQDYRADLPMSLYWELDDVPMSVWAFRVYAHLVRRAGKNGKVYPSYKSIGEACFRSTMPNAAESTLRRKAVEAVKELVDLKIITTEQRKNTDGSENYTNVYHLRSKGDWLEHALSSVPNKSRGPQGGRRKKAEGGASGTLGSVSGTLGSARGTLGGVSGAPKVIQREDTQDEVNLTLNYSAPSAENSDPAQDAPTDSLEWLLGPLALDADETGEPVDTSISPTQSDKGHDRGVTVPLAATGKKTPRRTKAAKSHTPSPAPHCAAPPSPPKQTRQPDPYFDLLAPQVAGGESPAAIKLASSQIGAVKKLFVAAGIPAEEVPEVAKFIRQRQGKFAQTALRLGAWANALPEYINMREGTAIQVAPAASPQKVTMRQQLLTNHPEGEVEF